MSKPNYRKQAAGLAALGRGPDRTLVHMSPREVASLQEIAKATGGSLTVNPKTGLAEAGWLDAILPVVAGGIATVLSGGTLAPILAGAATGALTGDKDQSLLMRAGLGALGGFGGSGIASSLGSMGAKAGAQAGTQAATEAAIKTGSEAASSNLLSGLSPPTSTSAFNLSRAASAFDSALPAPVASAAAPVTSTAAPTTFQNILAGAKQLGTTAGREAFMAGMPFGKFGLAAAAAPAISQAMQPPKMPGVEASSPTQYYIGADGGELTYNPYTEQYSPGMYSETYPGYAEGGQVPQATGLFNFGQQQPPQQQSTWPFPPAQNAQQPPQQQSLQPLGGNSLQSFGYKPEPIAAPPPSTNMAEGGEVKNGMTVSEMGQYYKSLLTPSRSAAVPPSSAALLDYMNRINRSVVEAPTPPRPTPPETSAPVTSSQAPLTYQTMVKKKKVSRSLPSYSYDPATQQYTQTSAGSPYTAGVPDMASIIPSQFARNLAGFSQGGATYAAGGKLLKGGGDGMSDSIPAVIQGGQKAALSQGEFVIPADVVSHVGNGSTEAGARRFYEMMDRVRQARTGTTKQAPAINPSKYMKLAK